MLTGECRTVDASIVSQFDLRVDSRLALLYMMNRINSRNESFKITSI